MSLMYSHPGNELNSGRWANPNPSQCPCRGGWLLSNWDTWHQCPLHGKGVPDPEDENENGERPEFDRAGHDLYINRQAYAHFRNEAERAGMTRAAFRAAVTDMVAPTRTPADWVNAADEVAEAAWSEAADVRAQKAGFSCRLEAAWAAEAEFEHGCGRAGLDYEAEGFGPLAADRNSWYRN